VESCLLDVVTTASPPGHRGDGSACSKPTGGSSGSGGGCNNCRGGTVAGAPRNLAPFAVVGAKVRTVLQPAVFELACPLIHLIRTSPEVAHAAASTRALIWWQCWWCWWWCRSCRCSLAPFLPPSLSLFLPSPPTLPFSHSLLSRCLSPTHPFLPPSLPRPRPPLNNRLLRRWLVACTPGIQGPVGFSGSRSTRPRCYAPNGLS
jgi:hypothetical protein